MNAEALLGTVLGTCTLQKLIGQGGMGAVFLAQQSRPKRQVAVKVLLPTVPLSPDQRTAFLERFRRETDVVASLEHPNIMPVHEYGERDGLAYLVMPYVGGGTLRDELERDGRLPLQKAVLYLEQLASALQLAHEHGVIHRDIKPANILLRSEGRLLLTDFGLVKVISEDQSAKSRLTGIGVPVGTPDYMAPEQVIGLEVDTRADLYSLGVILYQMVTGTVPFKASQPMQVAIQHTQMPPPSPRSLRPELPPAAEQVILCAMAKQPEQRYTDVQELAAAFRRALTISGIPLPDFSSILAPGSYTDTQIFTPRSLFDPVWQGPSTDDGTRSSERALAGAVPPQPRAYRGQRKDIVGKTSISMPSLTSFMPQDTPLPPTAASQPEVIIPMPFAPVPPVRSGIGHKFNLLRSSVEAEVEKQSLPSSPSEALEAQQYQNIQPPQANFSGFATPPQGSGLRPSPALPLQGSGLHAFPSSSPSEKSGLRPAPARLLGRSSLRPIGPMTLAGSGVPPLPTQMDAAPASPFQLSPGENVMAQPAVQPANAGLEMGRPTSAFPPATGVFGNPMSQPLKGVVFSDSATQSFNGSATQSFGNPATQQLSASGTRQLTGALVMGNVGMDNTNTGNTGMMKLSQAAKVVQVPVAGQPGRYVTGLLPVLEQQRPALPPPIAKHVATVDGLLKGRLKLVVLVAAVALVIFSSIAFFAVQSHNSPSASKPGSSTQQNISVTATANAIATAGANVILTDPLNENAANNTHGLLLGNIEGSLYTYKDNAYHITANSENPAISLVPNVSMPDTFAYTLTIQAVKGDETGATRGRNSFGMIFRLNQQTQGKKVTTTFYSFGIVNAKGGGYQFQKYQGVTGTGADSGTWTSIWPKDGSQIAAPSGRELHLGHGPNSKNVFKVIVSGNKFTFIVNGKQVGTFQDGSLKGGRVGMYVNLQGTEVAFSNLQLSNN